MKVLLAFVVVGRLVLSCVLESICTTTWLRNARMKRGAIVAERIRGAPLPMHVRAQLVSSLVRPAPLYAACVGDVVGSLLNSLTSAVMRAVWGTTRKLRCHEIVLTLLVSSHRADPRQVSIYQSL